MARGSMGMDRGRLASKGLEDIQREQTQLLLELNIPWLEADTYPYL